MAKHTPGPWKVWGIDSEGPHVLSLDATIVARLDPWKGKCRDEMNGNAHLIAAAPDLLDACHNAVQIIEQLIPEPSARGVADVVLSQLRAAIAKATPKGTP